MPADLVEHATGEFSRAVYVKGGSSNPAIFKGTVTTATSSTVFKSTELTGYGNDVFDGWNVYVFYDGGGTGAAPQGELQPISGYVSATGEFTHTAFTADLSIGDEVLIMHPYETAAGDATEAKQDTIIANQANDATEAKQDIIIANQAGTEANGSYNLPNDVAEHTVVTVSNTKRLKLDAVWLDFVNLVQDVTIKVYHKIDGTNYRQYDEFSWSATEEDGILLRDITIINDWKVSVTSTVAQGGVKLIRYHIIKTTMEA